MRLPSVAILGLSVAAVGAQESRGRGRAISGSRRACSSPGLLNAITDVAGVRVGHATLVEGDRVRTGVTAVVPHAGNLFQDKVAGAVFVGNAFGKLAGSTQVDELGHDRDADRADEHAQRGRGDRRRRRAGRSPSRATRTCGRSTRSSARPTTAA